jgi:hypothetical protein
MASELSLEEYTKLSEVDLAARMKAMQAYKLQREIYSGDTKSFWQWLSTNAATLSVLLGIAISALSVISTLGELKDQNKKTELAFQNQSTEIQARLEQLRLQVVKLNYDKQQDELKHFDELLRGASDGRACTSQRVALIWALEKYWTPAYELILANALASMIAVDPDQAVMESCAEVIGNAYGEKTPAEDQVRLRDLLYGDKTGNIGVVLRMENLIWERDDPSASTAYATDSLIKRARARLKENKDLLKMRVFYIGEAIRKNWRNLTEVNLEKTILPNIFLYQAEMASANLQEAILIGAHFFGADLQHANLNGAHLEGANLEGAKLTGAFLENAYLTPPEPEEVVHEPDRLDHTSLKGAQLKDAHLKGAFLVMADLTGAVLDGADLTDANLTGAIVSKKALEKTVGTFIGNPQYLP